MEVSSVFRYNAKDRIFQCYTCISVSRYAVLFRWSHFVYFLRWNGGLNRIYLQYAVLYLPPFWTSLRLSIHRSICLSTCLPSAAEYWIENSRFFNFSKISAQILSAFCENCLKNCGKFFANINHCWLFSRKHTKLGGFRHNFRDHRNFFAFSRKCKNACLF